MKHLIFFISMLSILLLIACEYKEDELSPIDFTEKVNRFDFPEGDDPWDMRLLELTKTYDVIPIYKSFTAKDLNRKWTGFSETLYSHNRMDTTCYIMGNDTITKSQVYTDFIIDEVFHYYNPEVANKILPMFFYFAEDMRQNQPNQPSELVLPSQTAGFDYWYLTFHTDTPNLPHELSYPDDLEYPSDVEVLKKWHQKLPLSEDEKEVVRACRNTGIYMYLEAAIDKNIITEPQGFKELVEYENKLSSMPSNPNYFVTRGFVHELEPRTIIRVTVIPGWGTFKYIKWHFRSLKNLFSSSNTKLAANNYDLKCFVRMAMRFTQQEFETQYPPAQYPLINERYHLLVQHFKNAYDIDLQKIAEGIK